MPPPTKNVVHAVAVGDRIASKVAWKEVVPGAGRMVGHFGLMVPHGNGRIFGISSNVHVLSYCRMWEPSRDELVWEVALECSGARIGIQINIVVHVLSGRAANEFHERDC